MTHHDESVVNAHDVPSSIEEVLCGAEDDIQNPLLELPVETAQLEPKSRIAFHADSKSVIADRFRLLRGRLRDLWDSGKLKTLLITSALPQDGKSTVALNLATALAERGKRTVLLIDADLHQATLTHRLGLKTWPGLTECLESRLDPITAIRRIEPLGWYLLPAGGFPANASELIQTGGLKRTLDRSSSYFDWIVIDSPPLEPLADTLTIAKHVDGTLLVARANHTPRDSVKNAIQLLRRDRVIGIVLNGAEGLHRAYSKTSTY